MQPRVKGFVTQSPGGRKTNTLPLPEPEAAALSHTLQERIRQEITTAGGWIPFARYMELALYAPGLGYYMAGQRRFGAAGDFITAPEMGSVFAAVLARSLTPYLGRDGILEFGAGSGALAAQLHTRLPDIPYTILELSPSLQAEQRAVLPAVRQRQSLPEHWHGVVLANELLDALPVTLVEKCSDGLLHELGVIWQEGDFAWATNPNPLDDADLAPLQPYAAAWPTGYRTELCPRATAWLRTVAASLQQGALVLVDYGHEAREYYHPQRSMGTLRGYYRHHVLDDPFFWPGLCDLTAHVNFSALLDEAANAGLQVAWHGNLARFLIDHGLPEVYAELLAQAGAEGALALNNEVKRLTLPQEMGESFKVLVLTRAET